MNNRKKLLDLFTEKKAYNIMQIVFKLTLQ